MTGTLLPGLDPEAVDYSDSIEVKQKGTDWESVPLKKPRLGSGGTEAFQSLTELPCRCTGCSPTGR